MSELEGGKKKAQKQSSVPADDETTPSTSSSSLQQGQATTQLVSLRDDEVYGQLQDLHIDAVPARLKHYIRELYDEEDVICGIYFNLNYFFSKLLNFNHFYKLKNKFVSRLFRNEGTFQFFVIYLFSLFFC